VRRPVNTLQFGISVVPLAEERDQIRRVVERADRLGVDLVGIQDHPYQRRFLDTWALIASLIPITTRIRFFPDVTNLPLRPPAMLAKAAATLDVLSGGRFELGIGAGGFWEAIRAMGGPMRRPGEALAALEEAIAILRAFWSGAPAVTFEGRHYTVRGLRPGPPPAHPIQIWVGGYRPRMLDLIGRLADGWVPSAPYAPPQHLPSMHARIDVAAVAAGRRPGEIRRLYNLMGTVTPDGQGEWQGPVSWWVDTIARLATDLRMDTFIFWPATDPLRQLEVFAGAVVPAVREAVRAAGR